MTPRLRALLLAAFTVASFAVVPVAEAEAGWWKRPVRVCQDRQHEYGRVFSCRSGGWGVLRAWW